MSASARRALNAVAARGTFSAAARELGVSQPAVAQQIRELQELSGAVLFERREGRLAPTPFCTELLDVTEQIEHLETQAQRLLDRRRATAGGVLRVGLGNSMPGMALIAAFQTDYPSVQVSVALNNYANTIDAVVSRQVDIGVLPDLPPDSRFERETLIDQEVVAIAHPDDPVARNERLDLRQLLREPLIFRTPGSSTQRLVDEAFHSIGAAPAPRLTLDTRDGVYEAVANRLGVGFMWRHGTGRRDDIRRIPVIGMRPPCPESVFRLAGASERLTDAFFATARAFRRTVNLS